MVLRTVPLFEVSVVSGEGGRRFWSTSIEERLTADIELCETAAQGDAFRCASKHYSNSSNA